MATDSSTELQAIKGIGPEICRWFGRALQITTLVQLRAGNAAQIVDRARDDDMVGITLSKVEGWIAQATSMVAPAPAVGGVPDGPDVDELSSSAALASIELGPLQIYQPPDRASPRGCGHHKEPCIGYVEAGSSFALEMPFAIRQVETRCEPLHYDLHFCARNLITGVVERLGEASSDDADPEIGAEQRIWLGDLRLPAGRYSLQVVAAPRNGPAHCGHVEIPVFQVA